MRCANHSRNLVWSPMFHHPRSPLFTLGFHLMRDCRKVVLPPIVPTVNGDRTESRVKMTRMRMRIAERLKSAQNTAAMLTTFQEVGVVSLSTPGFRRTKLAIGGEMLTVSPTPKMYLNVFVTRDTVVDVWGGNRSPAYL